MKWVVWLTCPVVPGWPPTSQATRQRLGLDKPVFYWTRVPVALPPPWQWHGTHNQYHHWAGQLLRGNLGYSCRDGQPVTRLLAQALAVSVTADRQRRRRWLLAWPWGWGYTWLAATCGGWRASLRAGLAALQVMPGFLVALALLLLFANPDVLNVSPRRGPGPGGTARRGGLLGRPRPAAAAELGIGRATHLDFAPGGRPAL
ncbi:MAG: hypothetical protein WKG07_24765 [Hymenobacter sp.]